MEDFGCRLFGEQRSERQDNRHSAFRRRIAYLRHDRHRTLGTDLKRDKINLIQTGVDPDRMVALENKAIDAGMLPPVATKVVTSKGFHNPINMHGSKLHYQNTGLTVKKITPRPIPKAVDGLPARRLERTAIFLEREQTVGERGGG